jgi:hypothetical protein
MGHTKNTKLGKGTIVKDLTGTNVFLFLFVGRDTHGFGYGKVISPQRNPPNGLCHLELHGGIDWIGYFCELSDGTFVSFGLVAFGTCGFGTFVAFGACGT